MIVLSDNEVPNIKTAGTRGSTFDPPPTYTAFSNPPDVSASSVPTPSSLRSRSVNYISLDRGNDTIRGHFTIDPFLAIPRSLLPPLAAGEREEDRKNLKLSTSNGIIDVDITLLGETASTNMDVKHRRRVTLDIDTENGGVDVRLRTSGTPIPFCLNVASRNGSITIRLPRTFKGLMTIHAKNGSITYSGELSEHMTVCNEDKHTQRRFVGDLSAFNDDDEGWRGDELNVETQNGSVKIYFVDEAREIFKGKCVLSRLLGNIFLG